MINYIKFYNNYNNNLEFELKKEFKAREKIEYFQKFE